MSNWIASIYTGNENRTIVILDAVYRQVCDFFDNQGNADYPEFAVESVNMLIEVRGNLGCIAQATPGNDYTIGFQIKSIPTFVVDYTDYKEGKLVLQETSGIKQMEIAAENLNLDDRDEIDKEIQALMDRNRG